MILLNLAVFKTCAGLSSQTARRDLDSNDGDAFSGLPPLPRERERGCARLPPPGHLTQHPSVDPPSLRRSLSLSPQPEHSQSHGWWPPIPTIRGGGGRGAKNAPRLTSQTAVLAASPTTRSSVCRGSIPCSHPIHPILSPASYPQHPIHQHPIHRTLMPSQMRSSRPTSPSTRPTTSRCATSSASPTSTRSPSTGPRRCPGATTRTTARCQMTPVPRASPITGPGRVGPALA